MNDSDPKRFSELRTATRTTTPQLTFRSHVKAEKFFVDRFATALPSSRIKKQQSAQRQTEEGQTAASTSKKNDSLFQSIDQAFLKPKLKLKPDLKPDTVYIVKPILVPINQIEAQKLSKTQQQWRNYYKYINEYPNHPVASNPAPIKLGQFQARKPIQSSKLQSEVQQLLQQSNLIDDIYCQSELRSLFPKEIESRNDIEIMLEQSKDSHFWDQSPPPSQQLQLNKALAKLYKSPLPQSRQQQLKHLVKSLGLSWDRAKVFKIINDQMYDDQPFQCRESKITSPIVVQAADLRCPKYNKQLKANSFKQNKVKPGYYQSYRKRMYIQSVDGHSQPNQIQVESVDEVKAPYSFSQQQQKTSYQMHKTVSPCRKTCSTSHGPHQYQESYGVNKLIRLNQTEAKFMIKQREMQPQVSCTTIGEDNELITDFTQIDYQRSPMYESVLSKRQYEYYRTSDGLYQLGEPYPDTSLYKAREEDPVLADNELHYYISLFQNKAAIESGTHDLNSIYQHARALLKREMQALLLEDKFAFVDSQYSQVGADQVVETLLKLLLRCRKMQECQFEINKILTLLVSHQITELQLQQLLETHDYDRFVSMFPELVRSSRKLITHINTLQDIEYCMKRPFVFKGLCYDEIQITKELKKLRRRLLRLDYSYIDAPELQIQL